MYIGPWQEYRLARAVRGRRRPQQRASNVELNQYYTQYRQMCEALGEAEATRRMFWDPMFAAGRQRGGGGTPGSVDPHSGLGTSHSTRSAPPAALRAGGGTVRYPSATPWDARSASSERPWHSGASARSGSDGSGLESGRSSRSMPPAAGGGAGGGAAAAAGCSAGVVPALTALAVAFAAAAATAAAAAAAAAAATTSADASLPVVATLRPEERSGGTWRGSARASDPACASACCAAAAKRPASSSAPVAHTCGCNTAHENGNAD